MIVTSLLRDHLPLRLWKAVHLTSYLLWPLAFVHGITAGTDLGGGWLLVLVLGCAVAATWASARRPRRPPEHPAAGGARRGRPHRHLRRPRRPAPRSASSGTDDRHDRTIPHARPARRARAPRSATTSRRTVRCPSSTCTPWSRRPG